MLCLLFLESFKYVFSKLFCDSLVLNNTGVDSGCYEKIRNCCYDGFFTYAGKLILNIFDFMIDSEVSDIAVESDKALKKFV